MVAPASRGSFRAARPKLFADTDCCHSSDFRQTYARCGNSAGRRIEPAGGGRYPQLFLILFSSLRPGTVASKTFP
jgi:hypothetical protein